MRGSFNAQPWGPVHDQQVQGVNQGISTRVGLMYKPCCHQKTDALHTDHLSGLRRHQGFTYKRMTLQHYFSAVSMHTSVFLAL
ncbi:hypothetical protein JB92DRAFT_119713 [Gautieria morchelliformis]|nr:hypothetical protein JB92DRAFT_119713 [Gautieria morchelliformis]